MQTLYISTRFQLLPLDAQLKETLLAALLPLAEAWSGVKLVGVDKDIYRYYLLSVSRWARQCTGCGGTAMGRGWRRTWTSCTATW